MFFLVNTDGTHVGPNVARLGKVVATIDFWQFEGYDSDYTTDEEDEEEEEEVDNRVDPDYLPEEE